MAQLEVRTLGAVQSLHKEYIRTVLVTICKDKNIKIDSWSLRWIMERPLTRQDYEISGTIQSWETHQQQMYKKNKLF